MLVELEEPSLKPGLPSPRPVPPHAWPQARPQAQPGKELELTGYSPVPGTAGLALGAERRP